MYLSCRRGLEMCIYSFLLITLPASFYLTIPDDNMISSLHVYISGSSRKEEEWTIPPFKETSQEFHMTLPIASMSQNLVILSTTEPWKLQSLFWAAKTMGFSSFFFSVLSYGFYSNEKREKQVGGGGGVTVSSTQIITIIFHRVKNKTTDQNGVTN